VGKPYRQEWGKALWEWLLPYQLKQTAQPYSSNTRFPWTRTWEWRGTL
jgi:hypothetical protein